jgi:hypothetical protein
MAREWGCATDCSKPFLRTLRSTIVMPAAAGQRCGEVCHGFRTGRGPCRGSCWQLRWFTVSPTDDGADQYERGAGEILDRQPGGEVRQACKHVTGAGTARVLHRHCGGSGRQAGGDRPCGQIGRGTRSHVGSHRPATGGQDGKVLHGQAVVAPVGTNTVHRPSDSAIGRWDAEPGSGSTGSGDARDRDPCGSERFPFLAAAAKHERISAHQPHDVGGRSTAGAAPDRNNAVKSLRQPGIVVSPMFVLVGNASAGTSLEQWRVSERCKA